MKSCFKAVYILVLTLSLISVTFATSFAPPKSKKIYSLNHHYFIDFNPDKKLQNVMKVSNQTPKFAWSMSYTIDYGDELFVSDKGRHVIVVRSKYVKIDDLHQPAVLIFNPSGLQATLTYDQLSTPRKYHEREIGPIGDFWRVWRENKMTITSDDLLHIKTENRPHELIFNLNAFDKKNILHKPS